MRAPRYTLVVIFHLICIGALGNSARGAPPGETKVRKPDSKDYTEWLFPVAIPAVHDRSLENVAKQIAGSLNCKMGVLEAKENPGCVIWLKVEKFTPNPGMRGYVIIVQSGGALVIGSDVSQLKEAAARIDRIRKVVNGKVYLPLGLATNYPVVALGQTAHENNKNRTK